MKRDSNRLDPMKVSKLVKNATAGRHADGGNLYLVVEPSGAARWAFLYRWKDNRARRGTGRLREMGLGSAGSVSLKRAREKAALARAQLADAIDPIPARKAQAAIPTFGEMADEVMETKGTQSRSDATRARNKRALEVYAESLRGLRVDAVDTAAVLDVLKPIWTTKPETAKKTRGLIEAVLNAAKARGFRVGENPAAWRGHLDHLLPKPSALARGHHGAMCRDQIAAFVADLRSREAISALALEFLILTAARSGEVVGATWREVDLKDKKLSTTKASGENRSTPIRNLVREDGKIFLQGVELGRAFSFVIDEKSGMLSVAVAREGITVSVFGACTPLAQAR